MGRDDSSPRRDRDSPLLAEYDSDAMMKLITDPLTNVVCARIVISRALAFNVMFRGASLITNRTSRPASVCEDAEMTLPIVVYSVSSREIQMSGCSSTRRPTSKLQRRGVATPFRTPDW